MAIIDKIKKYLDTHIAPVDTAVLAHKFLVTQGAVAHALKKLEEQGYAQRTKASGRFVWSKVQRPEQPVRHVAIPQDFRPVRTTLQSPHIRTSYPHIRGYDD